MRTKKRFVVVTVAGRAILAWLAKTVVGGVIYTTAAFLTKEGWERWRSGRNFWG